jgi:hypothetical protein
MEPHIKISQPVITETGYTKFNLSYPMAVSNFTSVADLDGDEEVLTHPLSLRSH